MKAISNRSTKACGALVAVAAALAGCATTGNNAATDPAARNAARPLAREMAAPVGYIVCSGSHASRFPEQQKIGRVCRPAASLQAIY
jgi:hypothetical protein